MKIEKTLKRCSKMTGDLLADYETDIVDAIRELEKDPELEGNPKLSISVGFVIEAKPDGVFGITSTMSFTAKKVKDKISANVSEKQGDLPLE